MKKLFIYTAIALASTFVSCKKDGPTGPAPTNLDASSFSHEAREGAVILKWATPDNANYKYIEVKYFHPGTQKEHLRLASVHANQIEIDELLKAYGVIEYKLTPVTAGGVRGTTQVIAAECLAKPIVKRVVENSKTELTLNANEMWTDSNQENDGQGLPGLIDGNNDTFWHIKWSPATNFPHYLVVKLPEDLGSAFSFYWKGRNNRNRQNPKVVEVYGSNTAFTGTTNNAGDFDMSRYNDLELINTFSGMPDGQGADYNSNAIILAKPYRYIWFKIKEGHNSTQFSAVAEWKVYKHKVEIYNPETGERKEI